MGDADVFDTEVRRGPRCSLPLREDFSSVATVVSGLLYLGADAKRWGKLKVPLNLS